MAISISILAITTALLILYVYYIQTNNNFVSRVRNLAEKAEKAYSSNDYAKFRKKLLKKIRDMADGAIRIEQMTSLAKKNYSMFAILLILLVGLINYLLFFVLPSIEYIYEVSLTLVTMISRIIGFDFVYYLEIKHSLISEIIKILTRALGIFLSISLTIFFFTYRFRKTIAMSSNLFLQNNSIHFIVVCTTLVYGQIIITNKEAQNHIYLFFSEIQAVRVLLWSILYAISVSSASKIIVSMLRSIDVNYTLENLINTNNKIVTLLTYTSAKRIEGLFDSLRKNTESLYQTLSHSVDKNIGEIFRKNFNGWNQIIKEIMMGREKEVYLEHFVPFDYLNRLNSTKFLEFYKTLLDSHIGLITLLYKNNKYFEAKDCISAFFNFEPHSVNENEALSQIYKSYLHELMLIIYSSYPTDLRNILIILEDFCSRERLKGNNEHLIIYKDLMLRAVEKNDVTQVSSLCYSLIEPVQNDDELTGESTTIIPQLASLMRVEPLDVNVNDTVSKYKKCITFIILQSTLKSIEVSNYSVTGFLIKYTVTNFHRTAYLIKAFETFLSDQTKNPFLQRGNIYDKRNISPNFNKNTLNYCTAKFSILLFGQQHYAENNKLPLKVSQPQNINFIPIDSIFSTCEYTDYLFKKIDKAKTKYGLLFLEDEKFIKRLEFLVKRYGWSK